MEDNSHAGQGPVVLDIGGDVGALIITMPESTVGLEIEARPIAGAALATYENSSASSDHSHDHGDHSHSHDDHSHGALIHVAVMARPSDGNLHYLAVFSELQDGTYEFYVRPSGPVQLTTTVRGGEVTMEDWPV